MTTPAQRQAADQALGGAEACMRQAYSLLGDAHDWLTGLPPLTGAQAQRRAALWRGADRAKNEINSAC